MSNAHGPVGQTASGDSMTKPLYDRLGGEDGITQLVDGMIDAYLNDPVVKTRFENVKNLDHAKRMAVEYFCAGSGGPQTYTGLDMFARHTGMNISEQEFVAVVDDIMGAMDKNNLGEDEKKEILAFVWSVKGEVIRL